MPNTTPGPGHNSADEPTTEISSARLKSFIKRTEKIEEDRVALCEDLREVYAEAKGTDFDTKTIRQVIRLRKIKIEDRREQEE